MFCYGCGEQLEASASYCPHCGVPHRIGIAQIPSSGSQWASIVSFVAGLWVFLVMPSEPSWGLDEDAARGVEVLSAVPIIFGVVSIVHKQHGQWMAVTGIILGTFCSLVALVSA